MNSAFAAGCFSCHEPSVCSCPESAWSHVPIQFCSMLVRFWKCVGLNMLGLPLATLRSGIKRSGSCCPWNFIGTPQWWDPHSHIYIYTFSVIKWSTLHFWWLNVNLTFQSAFLLVYPPSIIGKLSFCWSNRHVCWWSMIKSLFSLVNHTFNGKRRTHIFREDPHFLVMSPYFCVHSAILISLLLKVNILGSILVIGSSIGSIGIYSVQMYTAWE